MKKTDSLIMCSEFELELRNGGEKFIDKLSELKIGNVSLTIEGRHIPFGFKENVSFISRRGYKAKVECISKGLNVEDYMDEYSDLLIYPEVLTPEVLASASRIEDFEVTIDDCSKGFSIKLKSIKFYYSGGAEEHELSKALFEEECVVKALSKDKLEALREEYKEGTLVKAITLVGEARIQSGDIGYVSSVDDIGTIHVDWIGKGSLGAVYGLDKIEIVREDK